jgi:hypothetical protein
MSTPSPAAAANLIFGLLFALTAGAARGDGGRWFIPERIQRIHDFATLSLAQGSRLQGRPARFRVTLDSRQDTEGGRFFHECESSDASTRSLWLAAAEEVEEEMVVEAVLEVSHQPGAVLPGGQVVEGYTEYRLLGARRCR